MTFCRAVARAGWKRFYQNGFVQQVCLKQLSDGIVCWNGFANRMAIERDGAA
jgi:hypothetical protein